MQLFSTVSRSVRSYDKEESTHLFSTVSRSVRSRTECRVKATRGRLGSPPPHRLPSAAPSRLRREAQGLTTGLTRRLQRIVGEDSLDVLREQRSLLASECATYIMSAPQWEITRKVPFTNACFECSKLLVEQDWILFIHQFSDWVQHSFHP